MTARVIGQSGKSVVVATLSDITGGGGDITSSQITDATTVGKAVLTATDANTARATIGAGTSSLALGTTASTALAGNTTIPPAYTLIAATTSTLGGVKKGPAVSPCTVAADGTSAGTQLNALITALQTAGVI